MIPGKLQTRTHLIGPPLAALYRLAALFPLAALLLQACSAGSGGGGSEREFDLSASLGGSEFTYNGPTPVSEEVQGFKRTFYDPLAGNDRCGECHTPGQPGTTAFADQGDVNNAWRQARTVVNLDAPDSSAVVQRIANGHNCWLGSDQASTCAATITSYIERWAAGTVQSAATVQLLPRIPVSPSGTRVMPPTLIDVAGLDLASSGEVLELLNRYCSDCHSDTANIPQSPYFGSDNPDIAYPALRGKIDLIDSAASRIVLRLATDSHNCWDSCPDNAETLRRAVARFAAVVPETEVDASLVISMAQVLERDGVVATGGGRAESSLIAKWEFREGSGTTTADTSGVKPEIPLSLSGDYNWLGGWGVRFVAGKAQGGVAGSSKLHKLITLTGEYSIEAWIAPNNVSQENAWIMGYAGGPDSRNLLLSQTLYNYQAYTRSTATDDNNAGEPALSTGDDAQLAQATLQHVVVTYDPVAGRKIYVNGESSGAIDDAGGGLLNNWNEAFAVVLGNATGNTNPWAGTMRMLAVHNSVLSAEQVEQNFEVGVGQKYYLMFSVSELLDAEGTCHSMADGSRTNYCYVVFQVSQFDDSSYLFDSPFFVNINPDGGSVAFDLSGVHLGINGKLAETGQGFLNIKASLGAGAGDELGQSLASTGTIIPLENGADQDIFFLAFDQINGLSGPALGGSAMPFRQILVGEGAADIAVRTFDEINASFSVLTGVPVASDRVSQVTGKTVAETFNNVRRALPGVEDFQAFMSSHQMAATQLAAAYCDGLVQDINLRQQIFPAPPVFDFNTPVADPGIDWRNHIVAPLVDRAINTGLLSDTARTRIIDEVVVLITDDRDLKPYVLINGNYVSDPDPALHNKRDGLIYCRNNAACPASRTADVVKAACTAILGSGIVLLQ
ncbi:MAG: LamG domain-containing protein [Gammaproteobacteria bacterium]|nr:LamG domain-containing protein [Gammaproteobacteria bacterium]